MGLGLTTGGGDIVPHVRYDARAGRMFRADRVQGAGGQYETTLVDISQPPPQFAMDLANIEVGWIAYLQTGPDAKMVRVGQPMPAQPTKEHKQGFRVTIFAPKLLGGVREFASTAGAVKGAMNALHDAFEAAPEAKQGLVPIVAMTGTTPVVSNGGGQKTTNYAPVFQIVKWIERPAELAASAAPASPPTPAAHAPTPAQAAHVPPPPPPPAAAAPAPASADTEF
jgi:hypothetical protein